MAEDGKRSDEGTNRSHEWEVVSLTASTYAACPGPKTPQESGNKNESENESEVKLSGNESPEAMLQSQHFIFPPSHHEGLPIEKEIGEVAENLEISSDAKDESSLEDLQSSENRQAGELGGEIDPRGKNLKQGEGTEGLEISYNIKPGSSFETLQQSTESLRSAELFGENEAQIPLVRGKDIETLKGLGWIEPRQRPAVDDEGIGVRAAKLNIFHDDVGGVSSSTACDESQGLSNLQKEVQDQSFGVDKPFSTGNNEQQDKEMSSNSAKASKAKKNGAKDRSYEAWWKRQAAALRDQMRQSNTLWPIAIAVALTGLVIMGQRWQSERWQNQQLMLELGEKDEKVSQMMYQVSRLKEAITGRRKVPIIRSGST